MKCDKKYMLLYAVTDRSWVGKQSLYEQVESALKGGATCVQLREKELNDDEFLAEAVEIGALCRKYSVPFFVNDNVDVHTVEEALEAVKSGADCLGVGAMFSTSTKADADVLPKETLRDICAAVDIPVVAIGGISESNILQLSGTGVDGVALVSAIFGAEDIESECRTLRALSENMVRA